MKRMLFTSLVVAVSLGACADKKPGAPAPVATPDAPLVDNGPAALPNMDGNWSMVETSCGERVDNQVSGGGGGNTVKSVTTISGDKFSNRSVFTSKEEREIPQETKEDGTIVPTHTVNLVTKNIFVSSFTFSDRTEKTLKLHEAGSEAEVWQTEEGKEPLRLESQKLPADEKFVRSIGYSVSNDELIMIDSLSEEEAAENSLCLDMSGNVSSRELVTKFRRLK